MVRAIEIFALLSLGVVGLSHVTQPGAWKAFFEKLFRLGPMGALINGMLSLSFGALIVAFHDVWSGWAIVITLLGWAQVLKGALHLCVPGLGLRSMRLVEHNAERKFMAAGAAMIAVVAVIGMKLFA
jgi:hypothetical protein